MKNKKQIPFYLLLLIALMFQATWVNAAPSQQDGTTGPVVGETVTPFSSVAVSSLPLAEDTGVSGVSRSPLNPYRNQPDQGKSGSWDRLNVPIDPLIQSGIAAQGDLSAQSTTPTMLLSFNGTSNPAACGTCTPPNANGDVGPNHYVQVVEQTKVAIYSKTGAVVKAAFDLGALWTGVGGNCTSNGGSPIVAYDPLADRWVLTQNGSSNHLCFAVSKTADPAGQYWLYDFTLTAFADYLKLGVWPDGYYMSTNGTPFAEYVFNRANMLTGASASFQKFTLGTNFFMPSDLDGKTPPPAGSPNYFYTFKDNATSTHTTNGVTGNDRIEVYAFHVNWITPASSTFALQNSFDIAPFTYTVCGSFNFSCIQQQGTAQKLSATSEFPMFRFPYRNFGSSKSLVGTFTVGGGLGEAGAAIRWFELRDTGTGWALYQQGTFDPNDGNDRFLPSIAMDGAGNIALGYSVSSSAMHPSIRYTVHRVGDPLGTMLPEATMITGGGSQLGETDWGSYSSMSVDPADDQTFWYTNEYYAADSNTNQWKTLIGKLFKITILSSTFTSAGSTDGWVLESTEKSNKGGTLNATATTLYLGDNAAKKQYRSILSFSTAGLPDTAYITKATLKVRKNGIAGGGNPVSTFKGFMVDIKKGFFGTKSVLALADFNASNTTAGKAYGPFTTKLVGGWYTLTLTSPNSYINKLKTASGLTQVRLRFKLDDNNNAIANILKLYSGNSTSANRPKLILEYYIP